MSLHAACFTHSNTDFPFVQGGDDVYLRVHDTFAVVDLWEFLSFWSNCTLLQIAQREEPGHELRPTNMRLEKSKDKKNVVREQRDLVQKICSLCIR
jgi:hypothetical protein